MDASRTRDASPCPIGFIGDLDDPWVAAVAATLAETRPDHRVKTPGPLPEHPFGEDASPRAIVVHRNQLVATDAERLSAWRRADPPPTVILLISPYVRYEELERWSGLVEMVVSEAVAAEVLPGRLARRLDGTARREPPPGGRNCRIEVTRGDGELSSALVDACARAGYAAAAVDERAIGGELNGRDSDPRPSPGERVLTIWEVPVLEPGWAEDLAIRSRRTGPVIALGGFADRSVVARARESGAAACLELPCDLDDLIDVVDRVAGRTPADAWPVPARAEPPHRLPPLRRNPRRQPTSMAPTRWPDAGSPPRIPPSDK